MKITDIITAPWAIIPGKLQEIQAIYAAHTLDKKIDLTEFKQRIGTSLSKNDQGYTVSSGVAVIPISGVIAKKMNMFTNISGGVSTELIARDIQAALKDPAVNSIFLHIDSPGGTVDGTETLSEVVRAAAKEKPVVAFADGLIASAAYWIGSAASEIVAASGTTEIGSIGVVASHTDISVQEKNDGIKTTEVTAGKYKRIDSRYAPLSDEGEASIQARVDEIYSIFIDAVAENRGKSSEEVLTKMADGRLFLASEARDRGMIDYIASMPATIQNMANGLWPVRKQTEQPAKGSGSAKMITETGDNMKIEEFREKYPEIASQLLQEGEKTGEQKERHRIKDCEQAALLGHENLVNTMKFDGTSTGGDVALAIIGEEKKLRGNNLEAFTLNAPPPIPHAAVATLEVFSQDDNEPLETKVKREWESSDHIQSEFTTFGAFLSFKKVEKANQPIST